MLGPQHDRWLAAGAIWGPGLFIIAWVVGGFMVPGYSPFEDHISSLAAVDAPSQMVMTVGFAGFGLGVGTAAWPLRNVIGKPAAVALAFNALFVLGVALTPAGRSSDTDFLHGGFAFLVYLSLAMVGPLAALAFRRRGLNYWAIVSLAVGSATAVFLWISLADAKSGLFQRLGLTTTDIWLMAVGVAFVTGYFSPQERSDVGGSPGEAGEGGSPPRDDGASYFSPQ